MVLAVHPDDVRRTRTIHNSQFANHDFLIAMSILDRVRTAIRSCGLRPGARILVALSGGSDSMALLYLLRELESAGDVIVAGIAHLDHGLRDAAAADAAFCAETAARLDVPFRLEQVDVLAVSQRTRTSIEDAGRRARYDFLERAAGELSAEYVATGHTRDDQAETFLLRLIRGAGPRGLAGIRPLRGRVIRPLLHVGRSELRGWLGDRALCWRDDETNADLSFERNRVRHALIPYLEREFSPAIVDVLAREAEIAREDEDRLHEDAIEGLSSVVLLHTGANPPEEPSGRPRTKPSTKTVELDIAALSSLHPAVRLRVGLLVLESMAPGRFVGFEHVRRLLNLAAADDTSAVSLPGLEARRCGGRLLLGPAAPTPFANSFCALLSIPGEVVLEPQGWVVSAARGEEAAKGAAPALNVAVRADRVASPLTVRSRRRGDRFRPPGLGGRRKKLQDYLVDRKVARELRDSLPLVVDNGGAIVWVVGQSVAEDFRVTDPSQGVIFLKARRLGGPG